MFSPPADLVSEYQQYETAGTEEDELYEEEIQEGEEQYEQ